MGCTSSLLATSKPYFFLCTWKKLTVWFKYTQKRLHIFFIQRTLFKFFLLWKRTATRQDKFEIKTTEFRVCIEITSVICVNIGIGNKDNIALAFQCFLFIKFHRIIITIIMFFLPVCRSFVSRSRFKFGDTLRLGAWSWHKFPLGHLQVFCQLFVSFSLSSFMLSVLWSGLSLPIRRRYSKWKFQVEQFSVILEDSDWII